MSKDHPSTDNRILGNGVMREMSYDSDAGAATFYTGTGKITFPVSFDAAMAISEHFRRRYREGFDAGLAEARRVLDATKDCAWARS